MLLVCFLLPLLTHTVLNKHHKRIQWRGNRSAGAGNGPATSHFLTRGVKAGTAIDFLSAVCSLSAASDYKQFFT